MQVHILVRRVRRVVPGESSNTEEQQMSVKIHETKLSLRHINPTSILSKWWRTGQSGISSAKDGLRDGNFSLL
jgi:hypothetical protein